MLANKKLTKQYSSVQIWTGQPKWATKRAENNS